MAKRNLWIWGLMLVLVILFSVPVLAAGSKNLVKMGESVTIAENEKVRDVVVINGDINLLGLADGNLVSIGGSIHLGSKAICGGDVVTVGGQISKETGAVVKGDETEVSSVMLAPTTKLIPGLCSSLLFFGVAFKSIMFLALLVLAFLVIITMPKQIGKVIGTVEKKPWACAGWGLLGIILIVPLIILLAISIIGIAFIPLFILIVIWAVIVGYTAVAQVLGKRSLAAFKITRKPITLEVLTGSLLLWLIALIPILGWIIVKIAAGLVGFGAVVKSRFGTHD